ncbi:MAG: hypothetical protein LC114_10255 [Bryobacterales bacterium]|nr:hypothetical protein [Bryobacterales bacterium]
MEYIVDVPYIQQPDQRTCWNAGYKMMLAYKGKDQSLADNLPNDALMRERGILDTEFPVCRDKLGLTSSIYTAFNDPKVLKDKLKWYGPIWVSGFYCDDYKHIIVVRGIRIPWYSDEDDVTNWQVYVNDPYRSLAGAHGRPAWWSFTRFANKMNKVPFACQHWFEANH